MGEIKRGVSLYSFQQEYFLGQLDLQGCMRTLHELGIPGVEVIGEQMFPGFPNITDRQLGQWRDWLEQYELTPTCHDMFLDTKRYAGRVLNFEESVQSLLRDIRFAAKLGCPRIRVLVITPPEVVEACIPYAERYDVSMLLEVHAPWNFQHEWIRKHMDVIDRSGSKHVGLMPDFGIFVKRFPKIITERFVRDGATPELAAYAVGVYDADGDLEALPAELESRGGNAKDIEFAKLIGRYCFVNPEEMLALMPMIQHVQAKFYDMAEDGSEYSVPNRELIAVLKRGGYDGWLSSEYEGQRHIQDVFEVDSVEQVRRHHKMMSALLTDPSVC